MWNKLAITILVLGTVANEVKLQDFGGEFESPNETTHAEEKLTLSEGTMMETVSVEELQTSLKMLSRFNLSRGGVPPKVTGDSIAMQLRNSIAASTSNIFTLSDENAEDLITLVQQHLPDKLNKGSAGGMRGITKSPLLNDLGCMFTLKLRCGGKKVNEWRTFTGVCNNLEHTYWGSASISMRRFIPAQYADGFDEPRGTRNSATPHCETPEAKEECDCFSNPKRLLPNPRFVSTKFHFDVRGNHNHLTHMLTIFGQFVDHDCTFTPEIETDTMCCEDTTADPDCFPILIPLQCSKSTEKGDNCDGGGGCTYCSQNDTQVQNTRTCLQFTRSVEYCQEHNCAREQMNGITAFIDASNVYGSSDTEAADLRNGNKLRMAPGKLLPFNHENEEVAGDVRARENPALTSMHTIFLREHNRLVSNISGGNEYHQVRRIIGAVMQKIVFNDYLPHILGTATMNEYKLYPNPDVDVYDKTLDPSIRNEFSTAAFRFGHSMIRDFFGLFTNDLSGTTVSPHHYELKNHFFNTAFYQSNMDNILSGLMNDRSKKIDEHGVDDVTDFLFANLDPSCIGSDLFARNIQRGRDHGIPGYNDFREFCGMKRHCSWDESPPQINDDKWNELKQIYTSPSDIDLFTAGLAENPYNGGVVGRTFNCLIAKQFHRLKFGDRFFFSSFGNPKPFTTSQLSNIMEITLADLICKNTVIDKVLKDVFDSSSGMKLCNTANEINLSIF